MWPEQSTESYRHHKTIQAVLAQSVIRDQLRTATKQLEPAYARRIGGMSPLTGATARTSGGHTFSASQAGSSRAQSSSHPQSTSGNTGEDSSICYSIRYEDDNPLSDPHLAPEVRPGDPYDKAVTACIRLALALLRGKKSAESLTKMVRDVVRHLKPQDCLYHGPDHKMEEWVALFCVRLGCNFVNVTLTNRVTSDGSFEPSHWPANKSTGRERWQPSTAGTVFLNKFVCFPFILIPFPGPMQCY